MTPGKIEQLYVHVYCSIHCQLVRNTLEEFVGPMEEKSCTIALTWKRLSLHAITRNEWKYVCISCLEIVTFVSVMYFSVYHIYIP